jgi:serine phosphatase RsbU (regulator of sigma subunit)
LLIRDGQVVQQPASATTLPIGLGGGLPPINEHTLQQGDRVLCYTDGLIEERVEGGEPFA